MADKLPPKSAVSRCIDKIRLACVFSRPCEAGSLRVIGARELSGVLGSRELSSLWAAKSGEFEHLGFPESAGGVNAGDQRAMYYLAEHFARGAVLEIGTHIGCSTAGLALALRGKPGARLVTVDIQDVNDEKIGYYRRFGLRASPKEMMKDIRCDGFVEFVRQRSKSFLQNCGSRFDFIFLDGDHSAVTVYQEVSLALKLLSPDGVIVLHDYFSGGKPLWKGNPAIYGPYGAIERFIREGKALLPLPLGDLPWNTKGDSRATSLALLTRRTGCGGDHGK